MVPRGRVWYENGATELMLAEAKAGIGLKQVFKFSLMV